MIVLIFMKWSIDWEARMGSATCLDTGFTEDGIACDSSSTTADMCPLDYGGSGDGCQPPNLITTLINIALAPGSVDEPMYAGQAGVQVRTTTQEKETSRIGRVIVLCCSVFFTFVSHSLCAHVCTK